jgi:hypothetical protein
MDRNWIHLLRQYCRIGCFLIGVALVAGCAQRPPPVPREPPPPPPPKESVSEAYLACQANLSEVGWDFEPIASFTTPDGCGVVEGVKLQRSTLVLSRPTVVTCDLAYAIARFEFEILQPLAEELFKKEVKRVDHVGSYNCRGLRNNRARLSQHAKGRAIDIIGVELTDGTRIRVETDWADKGPKGQFLRRATRSACSLFSVVLGPNADRDHRDHLHLDVGPQRYCGA